MRYPEYPGNGPEWDPFKWVEFPGKPGRYPDEI